MQTERIKILGVGVHRLTNKEALENIRLFLCSSKNHHLVTLNLEMIVLARKDRAFRNIIADADLVTADGAGVLRVSSFLEKKKNQFLPDLFNLILIAFNSICFPDKTRNILPEKISGVDLIYKVCESDFAVGRKIYLLGAEKGVAEKTGSCLKKKFPKIEIVGAEEGIGKLFTKEENRQLLERINSKNPDIIFVAFGVPKQEKWIAENLKKIPSVRLAMGVGGSFDFISGKTRRAPKILQERGLEWLWRLIMEPLRIKRIYNVTFKIAWLILSSKEDMIKK